MELASLQEKLKEEGWNLSESGIELLSENGKITDVKAIIKKAIDVDLKSISQGALPEDINRAKYDEIPGNIVLQIQKVKNISNPKSNDTNYQPSNILKLNLTDGVQNVQAIQMEVISEIHPNTFPGSKIHITSENVKISHTYLQLFSHNTQFLGGKVESLVEKWELNKRLAKHKRDGMCENGPPPWIGFERKVVKQIVADKNFKSLDQAKNKDSAAENSEFEAQRKEAILEATKIGCTKVFGGGNKQLLDHNVQQIVDAGFSIDDAEYALKISKNNLEKALKILQNKKSNKDENSKTNGGNEEKKSVKTRGRNRDDELVSSLKPSGKVSLFEFLEDKLPIQDPPIETKPVHEKRNGNQQNFYQHSSKPNSRPNIRGNADRGRPRHGMQTEYEDRRPVDYRDKPDSRNQRKNYDSFRTFSKSDYTERRSYPEKKPDFGKFESQRSSNRSFDGGFRWDKFRTDFGNYKGNRDLRNGDYTSKNEFYKNKSLDKRGQVNSNPSAIKSQGRPMDLNENNNNNSSTSTSVINNSNTITTTTNNNNISNSNSNNNNNGGAASSSSKKSSGYMPVTERPPRFQKHQNQTNDTQASAQNWSEQSYNRIPQTQNDFQLQNSMANMTLQQNVPNYQNQNTQEGYNDILTTVVTPTNTKPNNLFFQNIVNQTTQSNDNRILVSQNSQPPPPPPPSHQSHIDTYGNRNVGTFIPQEVKNSTYTNIPNLHDVAFKNNGPLLHGYNEFQSVYAQPRAPSNSYPNTAYLTGPNGLPPQTQKAWIWNKGDKCMARYWEDQMYYNAVVTAVSENTCVVRFTDYGNYEEVLQDHCIPITES